MREEGEEEDEEDEGEPIQTELYADLHRFLPVTGRAERTHATAYKRTYARSLIHT